MVPTRLRRHHHYEPFGTYGNGVTDLKDLAKGATIIIPADDSNETRACSCSSRRA